MRKRDKWYIFFKSTCVALWSVNGGYRVGSKLMEVGVSFEGIQMLTSHMTHHPSESHRGQLYALPFSPQNWRQFSYNSFLPSCFPMTPYKERSIWQILAGNEWPSWALKQLIEAQLQGGELPLPRVFIESASDREPPLAVQSWTPYHMLS